MDDSLRRKSYRLLIAMYRDYYSDCSFAKRCRDEIWVVDWIETEKINLEADV